MADRDYERGDRPKRRKKKSNSVVVKTRTLLSTKPCYSGLLICLGFFLLVVLLASALALVFSSSVDRNLDVYNYCLTFEGNNKVYDSIPGDVDALGFGNIRIDSHSRCIDWEFFIDGLDTQVTKIDLMGPIKSGNPLITNDVFKQLTTSSNNNVKFEDKESLSQSRSEKIAKDPWKYYILVRTQNKPNGAVRAQLGHQCYFNKRP